MAVYFFPAMFSCMGGGMEEQNSFKYLLSESLYIPGTQQQAKLQSLPLWSLQCTLILQNRNNLHILTVGLLQVQYTAGILYETS